MQHLQTQLLLQQALQAARFSSGGLLALQRRRRHLRLWLLLRPLPLLLLQLLLPLQHLRDGTAAAWLEQSLRRRSLSTTKKTVFDI
jgi:hypothetical protein